ncbi:MAG TPA: hypothetical protein VIK71_07295 [Flavobacteriales bacterium]
MSKLTFIRILKSNVVTATLLFLFALTNQVFASWPPRDTLILDGDTIAIERRHRKLNLDSLQEKSLHDIRTEKKLKHPWSLALSTGWNQTVGTYQSNYIRYKPLDDFMNQPNSRQGNISLGWDGGCAIWHHPVKQGELLFTGHAGIAYNEINITTSSFPLQLLEQDSILGLKYLDNQLQLHYFTIFDTTDHGIIGEPDTLVLPVKKHLTHISTWDIPIRLRITYRPSITNLAVFGEIGVVYRKLRQRGQTAHDYYLVNDQAEYRVFEKDYFSSQNFLSPMFSIGAGYHFIKHCLLEKHWSVYLTLTCYLPDRALNPEGYFTLHSRSQLVHLSIRRTF